MPARVASAVAAVVLLLGGSACFEGTPRGTSSSISMDAAVYAAFRGTLRGNVTMRPPSPVVGQSVSFTLTARDDMPGALTLSISYDGGRPDDEGTAKPEQCPVPAPVEASRTEHRAFDRAGDHRVRLLVVNERCDDRRATIEVKATVTVRP